MSKVSDFRSQKNGQPYTIRVQRSMADHTVIDASFVEPDDTRAAERLAMLLDAMDGRMIATNEKILASKVHMDALIDAKAKEKAARLNGGSDADPHRPADVPADS